MKRNEKPYNLNPKQDTFVEEPVLAYTYDTSETITYQPEQLILEPDDDLRRAITVEELLVGVHEDIRNFFASIGK
ncbi:MAG: hypothetical protein LBU91_05315 [Bacteroidales bacterium]|jgi:hypothetical protein|nr:hypothetical protein [Bacteroidales bacterium]